MRYFKNNFFDGFRQDTFDLFLGRYVVHPSQKSPFIEDAERKNALIMVLLGIAEIPNPRVYVLVCILSCRNFHIDIYHPVSMDVFVYVSLLSY